MRRVALESVFLSLGQHSKERMAYFRLARELARIVPAARELYRDLVWMAEVAHTTWQPVASSRPEVELVECFRERLPLVHEEPVV